MNRRYRRIAAFLFAGLVATVAIAWTTALVWTPLGDYSTSVRHQVGSVIKVTTPEGCYLQHEVSDPWMTIVRTLRSDPGEPAFDERYVDPAFVLPEMLRDSTGRVREEWLPAAVGISHPSELSLSEALRAERYSLVASYGWPARAFFSIVTGTEFDMATRAGHLRSAVRISPPGYHRTYKAGWQVNWMGEVCEGTLPLGILWPGLIVDVCVLAAAVYLMLHAPGFAIRYVRRRRGLCPYCGYNLVGLPPGAPCPECGPTPHPQP